jgi:hypothetical protein
MKTDKLPLRYAGEKRLIIDQNLGLFLAPTLVDKTAIVYVLRVVFRSLAKLSE